LSDVWEQLYPVERHRIANLMIERVDLVAGGLAGSARHHHQLRIGRPMAKMDKAVLTDKSVTYPIPSPAGGVQMQTFIP